MTSRENFLSLSVIDLTFQVWWFGLTDDLCEQRINTLLKKTSFHYM
jgi:hypothetical protein